MCFDLAYLIYRTTGKERRRSGGGRHGAVRLREPGERAGTQRRVFRSGRPHSGTGRASRVPRLPQPRPTATLPPLHGAGVHQRRRPRPELPQGYDFPPRKTTGHPGTTSPGTTAPPGASGSTVVVKSEKQ